MENGHRCTGAEALLASRNRDAMRNGDRGRRQSLSVTDLGREFYRVRPDHALSIMIYDPFLFRRLLDQKPIAANGVQSPRIPNVRDVESIEQVRHQLGVIPMRMAEYQMIDPPQIRANGANIGKNPIAVSQRSVVIASGIVKQCEIGAFDEDG